MSRRSLTLLLVLFLVPAVTAGSATEPELVDPADDHAVTRACSPAGGPCDTAAGGAATKSPEADLLAVWVSESNDTHYVVSVQTAAAGGADTEITLTYNVTRTNNSFPASVPNHTISFTAKGLTSTDAPANTTFVRNATDDKILEVHLTRADTNAVGGDSITHMIASSKAVKTGQATVPVVSWTDTTTDTTSGLSTPYNLTRPAKVGNISLIITGGSLTESNNGTETITSFSGGNITLDQTSNGTANLTFTLTVTNNGLDNDTLVLSILDASGLASSRVTAVVAPSSVATVPGQTVPAVMTVMLNSAAAGDHAIFVQATSVLGGYAFGTANIAIPAAPVPPVVEPPVVEPPAPEPTEEKRKLAVAGLGFLTPAAEALGLIGPFGEYAELVLLAIILLLVVLVVFLVIFLATRGSVRVRIEPRKMVIAPGQTAEFRVEIKNRKGDELDALASFEGDPEWTTSLSFSGREMTAAGTDAAMRLGGKKDQDGVRHGILKVTAPEAADDRESDRVTVNVAPLRDDGSRLKTQRTQIRVQAHSEAPLAGDIRLAGVEHDPAHPEAGQVVETTARIENDSEEETMRLRVVLNVDGEDLQEQPLTLPPQQARAVVFTWQVPAGSSKVRVRIFSDE